ncbi:MAG: phage holin family protein [Pseudonocardiales bacterium]
MTSTYGQDAGNGGRPDVDDKSVGALVSELTSDLSTLMRQELELAKAELRTEAVKTGKAAGMLGGAGFAGWMVALFASAALMYALGAVMPLGWAALIVAVLWAIVGAVLFARGRQQLRQVRPVPDQTVQTLKEDVQWAKAQKN